MGDGSADTRDWFSFTVVNVVSSFKLRLSSSCGAVRVDLHAG